MLIERGDEAIRELKPLQLAVHVPWTASPLDIDAVSGSGQIARLRLPWEVIWMLAMEVRASIGGNSHSKALPHRETGAAGPGAILVPIEHTAPVSGRRA